MNLAIGDLKNEWNARDRMLDESIRELYTHVDLPPVITCCGVLAYQSFATESGENIVLDSQLGRKLFEL